MGRKHNIAEETVNIEGISLIGYLFLTPEIASSGDNPFGIFSPTHAAKGRVDGNNIN